MTSASRFFALALTAGCGALVLASDTGSPAGVAPQAAARQARSAAPAQSAARYLEYARASADWAWDRREESLTRWRAQFDPESPFGYRPPGGLLETALVYSYLYEKEGTARYAERARDVLLTYGDYRNAFPDWAAKKRPDYDHGVPALPDFFVVMRYLRAYDALHRLGKLSSSEVASIEEMVGHSIDYLLQTSEWGTMNRTVLRAESLAWAVKALPNHPRAAVWEKQRKALGDDNWGNWEIEDATIYHGVWLYALMGYADALGRLDELFKTPEVYYYAHYFLNLMSPASVVPDFGDAAWTQNWQHFFVFFEAAAARLEDPEMAWAAQQIAARFVDFSTPTNVGLACFLLDSYRWGGAGLQPAAPKGRSAEVMEDVQGKKIVFRSGWDPASTYLLLNYRDEGDGGMNFRDYLRDSLPVEEEKMTHGHADENSIVSLMSGGSILLRDGGYRDYMPSGPFGAYRQDYFHNRLVIRPEKIFMGQSKGDLRYSTKEAVPSQPLLEFLRNAGSYRPIRTRKVDFLSLPEFDYSRTRLIDDGWGYDYDRVIAYVKDPELFVVFDVFKSRTDEFFTLANLWHTRKIHAQGEHWYDTGYDVIAQQAQPDAKRLLVLFPSTHFRLEGVESQKRNYQDELTIHQTAAHHFEQGHTEGFVTVLVPHAKDVDPAALASRIRIVDAVPERAGLAVTIEAGTRRITVAAKQDLRMDIARDHRRPRYTFEKGRITYGPLTTDGDFLFASQDGGALSYTAVNMTRAQFGDHVLFQSGQSFHGLQFDGTSDPGGIDKVRYWRDTVQVPESVDVDTVIRTGRPEFDGLFPLVRGFLERSVLDLAIDGQRIRGYRTPDARSVWIRDHSDMMRAFRHFEPDVRSAVQHFADTQAASGRVFDYVTTFPEKPPCERENWTKYVRVPVEADVEYRFVKAAYLAWQASGDDGWMTALLPALERAMRYILTHPWYWDSGRGLVKRPYTIDTWDFAYTAGRHEWLQFQITDDTYWGYMHGDLSGYYEASALMAALHDRFGDERIARYWERRAADLRAAMNTACWNGRFYTHFVKITPVTIEGVDEGAQLSLSNPMAINRGAADHAQAVSILREYQRRGAEGRAFAEWFSIDPPFPDGIFGDPRLVRGAYVNGGIMPLVGGELARAAFEHGFEAYGADILARYYALIARGGEAYLWYFPDGRPSSVDTSTSPEAQPTDGWGSSAMAWALVEGLAGVVDRGRALDAVRLSPRWEAAGIAEAEVAVGYAASGASMRYGYRRLENRITLEVEAEGAQVQWHILLPARRRAMSARCNGTEVAPENVQIESSPYADGSCRVEGRTRIEIDITAA